MTWSKNLYLLLFTCFAVTQLYSQQLVEATNLLPRTIQIDPQEQAIGLRSNTVTLNLSDAVSIQYQLRKNRTLSDELQREMQDIYTYDLLRDGQFVGTYTWSPVGVWYTITKGDMPLFVYPDLDSKSLNHIVDYGKDLPMEEPCAYDEVMADVLRNPEVYEATSYRGPKSQMMLDFGADLREYRVAIVTTGEFYELNGRSIPNAQAIIASTFNGLNAIYSPDLSVTFQVVRSQIYTNSASDPFDPALGGRTSQAAEVVAMNFGSSQYDIGHALHRSQSGDGW